MSLYRRYMLFKRGFVAGLVAGAVGGVLLYKKRRLLSRTTWRLQARSDIYRRIRNLKRLTRRAYEDIVDMVLTKYQQLRNLTAQEVADAADFLKAEWENVKRKMDEDEEDAEDDEDDEDLEDDENELDEDEEDL